MGRHKKFTLIRKKIMPPSKTFTYQGSNKMRKVLVNKNIA